MSGPVLWTADEAAAATGGYGAVPWQASGVSIDTRTLVPGDLFVALKGPNFDGHDFVDQAPAAAAVVVDRPISGAEVPLLVVDDTFKALQDMGRAARARAAARVIAVTGSVGKTGTKEALRLALQAQAPTVANQGSLNNHWGLPLSLARMPRDAAYGVFEMGMNHPGEIAALSRLARPHVAVVTAVEAVHSAFFPSVEAIADAKAEVFDGMDPGGIAVLNRDNPHFDRLAAAAAARGVEAVLAFGSDPRADVRLLDCDPDGEGSRVRADVRGRVVDYVLPAPGLHWVANSLAVLAAVDAAGGEAEAAARALARLVLPAGRGRCHTVHTADGSFEVIDESYNASPVSMAAAFEVLGRRRPEPGGRRIAALGDMLELGADADALHAGLSGPLQSWGIDLVFTAGPGMVHLWEALPPTLRGGHASDANGLAPMVAVAVRPGDVVMVKGSAGSRTGRIVEALLALEHNGQAVPPRVANGE